MQPSILHLPSSIIRPLTSDLIPQSAVCSRHSAVLRPRTSDLSHQSAVGSRQSAVLRPLTSDLIPQSAVGSRQSAVLRPQSSVLTLLTSLLLLLLISACTKKDDQVTTIHATPYTIQVPLHFPGELNIPEDNPMTVEGIALGRYLFYDGRLSGRDSPDSLMSCSTCHIQAHSFVCGINHPVFTGGHPRGLTGIQTSHFMLPMINLVWTNHGYLWNGLVSEENQNEGYRELEDVVGLVIELPSEIHGDTNRTKTMIQSIKGYPELFEKAFGSRTVTAKNISRAIAQFVRTLISADSKFDRFMQGQEQLSPSELNGYVLFMTEQGGDCFHCHGGEGNPLFTTNLFYNNGKDSVFTDPFDRFSVTGNAVDIGAYKAPTLRNLVFTAPYMHDGRYKTIEEVIDFYSSGLVWSPSISPLMHHIATGGVRLTPSQKADLKAFLLTFTDSTFVTNPAFSRPDKMPDEQ
ncbi:MAG: cytochrome-c peroxidase [Bacteroidetes bacterium]|nr:cytochrome-c peroxidase [Bacteroidota bacterium]